MNKYKKLLSNTLLISMGTFGSKILVFLMVRFYTGILTPSDYGTSDLLTQTANLLFPLISLGITEGVFRFAMDKNIDKRSVFSHGLYLILLGSLLFFIIAPILTFVEDFKGYIWLIVLYTICSSLHALCSQYIRAIEKTSLFALQGIINTCLVIVLNIIFLRAPFSLGVTGYVLSVAIADALSALFLVFKEKLWRQITLKPQKSILAPMLKYSIPLIPTTVFWWITSVSDRYMVNEMISSTANGIYTVSYKLPTVLTLVSTMFMQAWQFSAVTEDTGDKKEHAEFYTKVWFSFQAILFMAGSLMIAFSKLATKILTDSKYYSSWEYVPLLTIAMVFTAFASFAGTVYTVTKKSNISFITAFIGAGSNIVLNMILIPSKLGVQGAAIATVASYLLCFIIRGINSQKYIPYKMHWPMVIANTVIIFVQATIMIFEVKLWPLWQAACVFALFLINFKAFMVFLMKIITPIKARLFK